MRSSFKVQISGEEAQTGSRIQLNKTLIDLRDLTKRGINFTNAITFPPTSSNNRLLGNPNRLASDNRSFETQKQYSLLDARDILSTGNVVVKSHDPKRGTKVQLAEGFDFWSKAGSKLMNDLELHDFDFVFNTVNMDARKTKAVDVFITALHLASGVDNQTALSNYQYTRPCYYWKRVLDLIVEELGYTIDYGNSLQLTELNNLGNLSNAEKFFVSDYKIRFQNELQFGTIDYSNATSVFAKAGASTSQAGSNLNNANYKTSYVFKGTVSSLVDTEIEFSNGDKISIARGTSFVNYRTDELDIGTNFSVNFQDELTLEDVYIYSAINEGDIFEIEKSISITDYLVLADYNLPDYTYKRFIKIIMSLLFLDFEIDNNARKITVRYLPDIISTNNVQDFSQKVQRNAPYSGGRTYGQLSVFSYSNDEEINEAFGTAFVNIHNDNAPETKTIINIPEYSASNEVTISGENIISVPIYNSTEFKRESIRDRIVFLEEVGSFGINAVFSRISWQKLYANHYIDFVQATQRERVMNLEVFMNNRDYRNLQKAPVIYVDYLESTFLITEIRGYEKNKLCKLKAIKYN